MEEEEDEKKQDGENGQHHSHYLYSSKAVTPPNAVWQPFSVAPTAKDPATKKQPHRIPGKETEEATRTPCEELARIVAARGNAVSRLS